MSSLLSFSQISFLLQSARVNLLLATTLTSVPVSGGICILIEAQPVSPVLAACLLLFHPAPIG